MLVAPEPAQLVESTLRLVEGSAGEDGFPAIRAGIAYGPVVNRWGDWYGSTVNVASRLTTRARPASVLTTEAVRDAASDGYEWSFAGDKRLKGLSAHAADVPRQAPRGLTAGFWQGRGRSARGP